MVCPGPTFPLNSGNRSAKNELPRHEGLEDPVAPGRNGGGGDAEGRRGSLEETRLRRMASGDDP